VPSGYSTFEHLAVEVRDGVAVVRFDPQAEGDVERSVFTELRDIFSPLGYDSAVQAVVLTGDGDVFFGGVGRERTARLVASGLDTVTGQILTLQQVVAQILSFRKPLVAAVNGKALNVGGQIALLCDAAVAAENVAFGDNHLEKGVAAGDGGTMLWPLLVGMARAREILLLGRELSAREALELHLVAEVVERERTLPVAIDLAHQLARLPRLPYVATKQTIHNWWRLSSMLSWDLALAVESAGLTDPEHVAKRAREAEE
jgi:enoyl-CoA hydratase